MGVEQREDGRDDDSRCVDGLEATEGNLRRCAMKDLVEHGELP